MTENGFYKFFYHTAEFFRSLAAVIIFLVCLVLFQIFETQTLFERILPIEHDLKRLLASTMLAIAYEVTQLIFTANKDNVHKRAPELIGVFSFVINVWFFRAWEGEYIMVGFKFFTSGLLAYLNYNYSDLFLKKWKEATNQQTAAELAQSISESQQSLIEFQNKISQLQINKSDLEEVSNKIQTRINQLTCKKCGRIAHNQQSLNAHQSKCTGGKINGSQKKEMISL